MRLALGLFAYESRSLPFMAQRLVNFFAEPGPNGAKSEAVLYNAPGIKAFGSASLAGAVRGFQVMDGVLYAVAGNTLYSITSAGAATSLGTIDTHVGPVAMAVNRASPQELAIADGVDGYTYDTSNGLREIDDAQFGDPETVTFQDGYFIWNDAGTSQFFLSAIDDGRSYAATDFADAESSATDVIAVFSNHQQLWVFKADRIEVWYNSGNADFPFERIAGGVIQRGCGAAFSIAADDNTLFWLGEDRMVYRAAGFTPQRVSTHAIEEILRKMSSVADAFAFFVTLAGHKFYVISFPAGQRTFVLDLATNLWHERESFEARYWRVSAYVFAYGKHLIGDAFQGRLGELDPDTFTEFGATMQGIMSCPTVHADRKRVFHERFEVEVESGTGLAATTTWTNLMLYSEQFDNAAWVKAGLETITADQTTAPDGATTAEAYVPDNGAVNSNVSQTVTVAAATTHTFSVYIKTGALGNGWIELTVVSTSTWRAWFDIATGAKGSSSGSPVSYSIGDVGGGWYRLTLTVTTGTTTAQCFIAPRDGDSGTGDQVTGNGTDPACYIWGAQLETGAAALPHIQTEGSAVSRAREGEAPRMWLDWSDDGGRTFNAPKALLSMGKPGEYRKRLYRDRLGSARERIYRLTVADAVKRSITAAHLDRTIGKN